MSLHHRSVSTTRVGLVFVAALAALLGSSRQVEANVYAAHLQPAASTWDFSQDGTLTLSYRLNEPATSVTVEIYRAGSPEVVIKSIAGGTAYGLNSVVWDGTDTGGQAVSGGGDYKFRIVAEDAVGKTAWTNITPTSGGNEIGDAQFYSLTGVAVNREPSSINFGRIYVANSLPNVSGNPGATAGGDGIFLLNSDMTFRGGSAATAAAAANSQLVTNLTNGSSPFKLSINQDNPDDIVLADFNDNYENVWIFNGDGTAVYRVLDSSTTGPTKGAAYNHGNAISAALTGVGAERKLWTIDEDKDVGATRAAGGFDLVRYDIAEKLVNYTGAGIEVKNGGSPNWPTGFIFYTGRDLKFGRVNGTTRVYAVCRRANASNTNLAIVVYALNESGVATGHVWYKQNQEMTDSAGVAWNYTAAVGLDEERGRVAIARDAGDTNGRSRVAILNSEDGAFIAAFDTSSVGGGAVRCLDFDAAGNLYTVNSTDQHVRMWSPPDGPNTYTTPYADLMSINCTAAAPTIISAPTDTAVCATGGDVSFTVNADGHGEALSYEWKKGTVVVGAGATLTINPVTEADAGTYSVTVIGCQRVTPPAFALTVNSAPTVTAQPASVGLIAGQTATFTVAANVSVGDLSYQWKQVLPGSMGAVDVGTDSPTLVLPSVTTAMGGSKIYVEVTGLTCGLVSTSSQATLNVLPKPCNVPWADADGDLDVDGDDFAAFQRCLTNGNAEYDVDACGCFDQDADTYIDELDLQAFIGCGSGPMTPAEPNCGQTILFADDFDSAASAAGWTVSGSSDDYTVTFGHDYGAAGIPAAPYSLGTTKGLFVSVNDVDGPEATDPLEAAIAYSNQVFTGDYAVQFDMWIQYAGSGTTEHAAFGIDGDGSAVQRPALGAAGVPGSGPTQAGYVFSMCGEAGDTVRDYRAYEGLIELIGSESGYLGGKQISSQPPFAGIFPSPKAPAAGAGGNTTGKGWGWVRVEISQVGGELSVKLNGNRIASRSIVAPVSGQVMLGHTDLYGSINNKTTYVIFDNLRVISR